MPDELPLDPVDSNLVDALDQMVDALQAEDVQARTVLLTARPELAEYTECLVRLDALLPASAVAGARERPQRKSTFSTFSTFLTA